MRISFFLTSLFFIYFIYGLFLSQFELTILPPSLIDAQPQGYFDYKGVTNANSNLGVGTISPSMLIEEAKQTPMDFLFLTDLNLFSHYPPLNGYHENLLVFEASKYSYLDSRIMIYEPSPRKVFSSLGDVQLYLTDQFSQPPESRPYILTLAHPFKKNFNWSGEYPIGLDAIEVINLKSVWQKSWDQYPISFIWSALIYPFNPNFALMRLFLEPNEELHLWDEMASNRNLIGMVGNDASSRVIPFTGNFFRFPTYKQSFSVASNHVILQSELTGKPEADQKKIMDALKRGQFYLSIDLIENPRGFNCFIMDKNTKYLMGSTVKLKKGLKFVAHLPQEPKVPYEIVFFRNGQRYATFNEYKVSWEIKEAGSYRVQVRVIPTLPLPDGKKWFTWIYSNYFYVK